MGYFSNLAMEYVPYDHDYSYAKPEQQLLWRLEDLENRREELAGKRRVHEYSACFSDEDLRYILPEHLKSAAEVASAIELAVNDLAEKYGIYVREKPAEELPVVDEITDMQVSFLDVLAVQARTSSVAA